MNGMIDEGDAYPGNRDDGKQWYNINVHWWDSPVVLGRSMEIQAEARTCGALEVILRKCHYFFIWNMWGFQSDEFAKFIFWFTIFSAGGLICIY